MGGVRSPGAPQSACARESMRGHFLHTRAFLWLLRGSQREPEAPSKTPLERTDCSNVEDTICRTSRSSQRQVEKERKELGGGRTPARQPPAPTSPRPLLSHPQLLCLPRSQHLLWGLFLLDKAYVSIAASHPLALADIPGQPRWAGPWGGASQRSLNSLR